MKKMVDKKGITLIALVITIIVLLILAGITINLTIGQDGIIKHTQEAGIEYEKAQLKEELELAILDIRADKLSKGQSMKREYLMELEKIGVIMESVGTPAEGQYKDWYFEIDENYVVTILEKVKGERPSIQAEVITSIVGQGGTVEIKVTASISEGAITTIESTNGAVLKTDISATEKIFEVSANGIYTFKVTADNGRSATSSVEVNTIIEKPVIQIKNIEKTEFTIEIINNYTEGLITEYKYYVAGTLKSEGTTLKEFTVTELTAETDYSNIYVEAYIGEIKLTSEVTTATTKSSYYSWEELSKIAKAISDDNTITNETAEVTVTVDEKDYTVKVGDITKVKVNGTAKTVRIMGFNHDTLADQSVYGGKNIYAGISFEFVDLIKNARIGSSSPTGWADTELRNTLNNTTINTLSNSAYIKEVNKSYIKTYSDSKTVTTCQDKLWLLSCSEIWNNGKVAYGGAVAKEGEQYKYYKDINATYNSSNTKLVKGSVNWWLRSPYYYTSNSFCMVYSGGKSSNNPVGSTGVYVAPGFAI